MAAFCPPDCSTEALPPPMPVSGTCDSSSSALPLMHESSNDPLHAQQLEQFP